MNGQVDGRLRFQDDNVMSATRLSMSGRYGQVWWRFGAVGSDVGSDVGQIDEVTRRRARLVLGWVTVSVKEI